MSGPGTIASVRGRTVSVVAHIGPTANLHTAIVSRETVPMREELFDAQKLGAPGAVAEAFHRVQRHIAEATQAARSLPFNGGVYMPNVAFAANVAQALQHGCPIGLPVAWDYYARRPVAANSAGQLNEVTQDPATGRVTLQSTDAATYDLFFFTRPGALR
jgi:hypothetical protein